MDFPNSYCVYTYDSSMNLVQTSGPSSQMSYDYAYDQVEGLLDQPCNTGPKNGP